MRANALAGLDERFVRVFYREQILSKSWQYKKHPTHHKLKPDTRNNQFSLSRRVIPPRDTDMALHPYPSSSSSPLAEADLDYCHILTVSTAFLSISSVKPCAPPGGEPRETPSTPVPSLTPMRCFFLLAASSSVSSWIPTTRATAAASEETTMLVAGAIASKREIQGVSVRVLRRWRGLILMGEGRQDTGSKSRGEGWK